MDPRHSRANKIKSKLETGRNETISNQTNCINWPMNYTKWKKYFNLGPKRGKGDRSKGGNISVQSLGVPDAQKQTKKFKL